MVKLSVETFQPLIVVYSWVILFIIIGDVHLLPAIVLSL